VTAGIVAPKVAVPLRAWTIFGVVYLAATVAPFNQYKVPPLIPVLLTELSLTEFQAGLLMSVFSLSGLVLALPSGMLYRRFGPRLLGTAGVASTAVGAAIGALAPDASLLLLGRLVEGIGMGMSAVFALVTIAAWFPPERRGLPIAIFTTWIPVGQLLAFLVAPRVYEAAGWRAMWWVGAAVALVCASLYAATIGLPAGTEVVQRRDPRGIQATKGRSRGERSQPQPLISITRAPILHEPGPWLLAAFMSSFHVARNGFATWTPLYLVATAGWALGDAAWVVSLCYMVSIPAALPAGWVLDHARSARTAYTWAVLLAVPALALAYALEPSFVVGVAIWTGLLSAVVPTAVNTATPRSVSDQGLVGPAVGVVAVGRNAGQLMAPLLLAPIVQAGLPWTWVGVTMAAVSVLGLVAGLRARTR
jgi:MFS family permease